MNYKKLLHGLIGHGHKKRDDLRISTGNLFHFLRQLAFSLRLSKFHCCNGGEEASQKDTVRLCRKWSQFISYH